MIHPTKDQLIKNRQAVTDKIMQFDNISRIHAESLSNQMCDALEDLLSRQQIQAESIISTGEIIFQSLQANPT